MRRVLVIAYYFPPLGGAGVQRTVKFVRYLREFGYEPVVLAGPAATRLEWAPTDETLARELPDGVEVHRIQTPEPRHSTGWRGRAERWFRRPSPFSRWWRDEIVALGRTIDDVEVIYASMSPWESAESAARLARQLGRPWIADLRDPWALDEWAVYPTALHRYIEVRQMQRHLSSAAAVVLNTPDAAQTLSRRIPRLRNKPMAVIPNGFDADDFSSPAPSRRDEAFRIVYAGYSHVDLGLRFRRTRLVRILLGGAKRGFNPLTRSHVFLLEAAARAAALKPDLKDRIEVHLAGPFAQSSPFEGSRSPLRVCMHGYLAHPRVLELVRSADLLFLPMQKLPRGTRAQTIPGKTYEYLAANRPILGAVPPGDIRELLISSGSAFICEPDDIECMAAVIAREASAKAAGRREPGSAGPNRSPLDSFERRELTRQLALLFDSVVAQTAEAGPRSDPRFAVSPRRVA